MHGKGSFTWVDGIAYSGDFVHDAIEGLGTYTWPDGAVYEGEVHLGRRHGQVRSAPPRQRGAGRVGWPSSRDPTPTGPLGAGQANPRLLGCGAAIRAEWETHRG